MCEIIFEKNYLLLNEDKWEFPSGSRRCDRNRKVPGWNPARRSVGLRDPNSLWGSRWPSVWNLTYVIINIGEEMLSLREWPKVGRGAAKKQIKKNFLNFLVNISKLFKCTITEKEASLYLIHVKTIHLNIVNILYGIY